MRLTEAEYLALIGQAAPAKRKNKHGNIRVYVYKNGFISEEKLPDFGKPEMVFDSKKEYNRWEELKLLERAKVIENLERQVPIIVSDGYIKDGKEVKPVTYKADFTYLRDGAFVVEDVKPYDERKCKYLTTKDFNLKWKIMRGRYPNYTFEIY